MASPFRVFRKYQKTLLVVAGVILMFVFVIGDALVGYLGRSRRSGGDAERDSNAVAVRWSGKSLTNAELHNLVMRRRILNAFIQGVEFAGRQAAFEAGVEPRSLRVEPILGPETPQQGVERSVVQTQLFADAARKAGMRISDDTIVQYLDELGRGNVTRDEMRAMLNRLQSGNWQVSIDYLIDALREEMLARNYIASHQFAFDTVTPQQRWEDWLQVNDRIVLEAAAIPAEDFLAKVPPPTEAELVAFFDEHKNREPQPDFIGEMEFPSPTPGFRIPRKIDVQFIQANYDKFLTKIEDEITDEEIEKYYEENKDPQFIEADTTLFDESNEEAASDDDDDSTTPPSETPAGDEEQPATPDDTSTESEKTPADNKGAEEKTEEAAPNDGDQSSRDRAPRSPFRLTAFLQEADTKAEAASGEQQAEPAADADATETAAPTDSPEAGAAPAQTPPAESPAEPKAETASEPAAPEKPKQFQPLDEVRDVIRRELAQRRAAEQLNELISELAAELDGEFSAYFGQVLDAQAAEEDSPAPPAALVDLAPLAKEHGLEHGRTGPMSLLELRAAPVGKSGNVDTGASLWQSLFLSRDLELYQPITTVDIDGNRFIALKMSDTPGRVPEFAEVEEEVRRAWKQQEAGKLALKEAEADAEKAQEAHANLADYFSSKPSVDVIRTDPFSQYTGGDVGIIGGQLQQQPFRLSEPDGIVAAGPDFLRRVFELKDGEIAAVLNHDHSIAYVIRVVEHMSSPQELRTAYLSEANTWPGLRLMIGSHARVAAASLVNDIVNNAGLEWERPNDQVEENEEEAG